MNYTAIIGNLANDPEARTTQSGIANTTFRVAVQRRYRNANGDRDADFFTVVTWRQTAEFCAKYLTKGRKVCVEGAMQCRSYEAQDGTKRYVWELVADHVDTLDRPADRESRPEPPMPGFAEVDDDELPFD